MQHEQDRLLFDSALKITGSPVAALATLARAGRIAQALMDYAAKEDREGMFGLLIHPSEALHK